MLLSDRDIAAEIKAGRVQVEPFDPKMIQPSSVDVRLDRFFRVFENHKYEVIDPGFSGHITLELSNVANLPVKLYPGMKIGQLCLIKLSSAAEHPYGSAVYGSRYQGQRGPTPSKSWLNFHKTKIQ